jgi:predicted transcriptional regulator of viral defense system
MYTQDFFNHHPVFRYQMFKEYMASHGITRDASVRQLLNYAHKNKKVMRIRRLLYASTPPLLQSEWIDPYLITAHAVDGAVIAYHTALELHNLAYTSFDELVYLTHVAGSRFSFQHKTYRPVCYPQKLISKKQNQFEVMRLQRQGMIINVTSLERTIVDVLDRPNLAGGLEEVMRSLEHLVNFDVRKIIAYTLLLEKASIAAKVGYFLEQLPKHLAVSPSDLKPLLTAIPKQTYYFDSSINQGEGTYIAKWHLIVPNYLLKHAWEEQNADTE